MLLSGLSTRADPTSHPTKTPRMAILSDIPTSDLPLLGALDGIFSFLTKFCKCNQKESCSSGLQKSRAVEALSNRLTLALPHSPMLGPLILLLSATNHSTLKSGRVTS